MPTKPLRAKHAAQVVCQHLQSLDHPAGVVRLTMFAHESEGIRKLKTQVAEAVILTLEANGFHILNGLSEAAELLTAAGYHVTPPKTHAGNARNGR